MSKVGVFGSINTDFVSTTGKVLPREGETIQGNSFSTQFGGKGANKAVALARLGANVVMFGAVGDDEFSKRCLANLEKEKVCTKYVKKVRGQMGGIANIFSSDKTNMIVVAPGANLSVDISYIDKIEKEIKSCDLVVADLEVPQPAVVYMSEICKKHGVKFVLNPSPIMKFNKKMLKNSDLVVVNEVEIKNLPGYKNDAQILEEYSSRLILTKGKEGALIFDGQNVKKLPALKSPVVDTTGAGDTFLGGLIVSSLAGKDLEEAVKFANICAGLKISKLGAQTGMPKLSEVKKYIISH